jgi:large subunit ribosomal protein L32
MPDMRGRPIDSGDRSTPVASCVPARRTLPLYGYTRPPMAVPKRKTSKSRRDKRRAQHGISAPRLSICPNCHQPTRPHQMCPTCKTYRGREVEPLAPLGS